MKTLKIVQTLAAGLLCLGSISALAQSKTPLKPIKEVFSPATPQNPADYIKVAAVQWNPYQDAPVGASKAEIKAYLNSNRKTMAEKIAEAATNGAQFIVLSEFAVVGYPDIPELPPEEDEFRSREDIKDFVDTIPGDSTAFFTKVALKHKVWIQFGMAELEQKTNKYFNTAVVINDKGQMVATFRKNNLYEGETHFLSPGSKLTTFESPMGKVGLVICADIYDYDLLHKYKAMGVKVLSLSTSWAQMNSGMGYFQRAAEYNKAYVIAANQTYFPDSGVINPDGSKQSHVRQSRDVIAYGFIPKAK